MGRLQAHDRPEWHFEAYFNTYRLRGEEKLLGRPLGPVIEAQSGRATGVSFER